MLQSFLEMPWGLVKSFSSAEKISYTENEVDAGQKRLREHTIYDKYDVYIREEEFEQHLLSNASIAFWPVPPKGGPHCSSIHGASKYCKSGSQKHRKNKNRGAVPLVSS